MSQLFRPYTNYLARYSLPALVLLVVGVWLVATQYNWSPWGTEKDLYATQPVPFSHEHHVSGLGIGCRYCHTSVEASASAGMPSTHTCMTCHSQLWTESDLLKPVRSSFRTGRPLQWNRVYDLPDYVYFNHSIHVDKGVGCETCHGRVDQMPLTLQAQDLFMGWCLDCHRHPERYLRPQELIYAFGYAPPAAEQRRIGRALIEQHDIDPDALVNCSICHR